MLACTNQMFFFVLFKKDMKIEKRMKSCKNAYRNSKKYKIKAHLGLDTCEYADSS